MIFVLLYQFMRKSWITNPCRRKREMLLTPKRKNVFKMTGILYRTDINRETRGGKGLRRDIQGGDRACFSPPPLHPFPLSVGRGNILYKKNAVPKRHLESRRLIRSLPPPPPHTHKHFPFQSW